MPGPMLLDAALYYPFINFRDEGWLKRAVLYWDVLWRIAPHGHEGLDPPSYWQSQPADMSELEGRAIVRRCPPMIADVAVAELWTDLLAACGDELAQRYPVALASRAPVDERTPEPRGYLASPIRRLDGLGWLLRPKMPPSLADELGRLDLLVDGRLHGAPGWFALDERLLDAYMTTLANEIIGARQMETVTDVPRHFRRFTSNSVEALRALLLPEGRARRPTLPGHPDDQIDMMAVAIEAVYPAGIDGMTLGDVLALRDLSADARAAFKVSVTAMVDELRSRRDATLTDAVAAAEFDDLRQRHIDQPLAELRKALRWHKVDGAISVLTLKSAFERGTLAAVLLGAIGVGIGGIAAAGLAVAGLAGWREARARKAAIAEAPVSWLLDVERTMDARTAAMGA